MSHDGLVRHPLLRSTSSSLSRNTTSTRASALIGRHAQRTRQPILVELEHHIRSLIAHLDKSHNWRHVVPGADRPWNGDFRWPALDRNGSFTSTQEVSVVVWNASIVSTGRVKNAIIPLVGPPLLGKHVNQVQVPQEDGSSDLWEAKPGMLSPSTSVPFRGDWYLYDFHGVRVKVAFVSSQANSSGDSYQPVPASIHSCRPVDSDDEGSSSTRSTRHPPSADATPPRRRSTRHSLHDATSGSSGDSVGGEPDDPSSPSSLSDDEDAHVGPAHGLEVGKSTPAMSAAEQSLHEGRPPPVSSLRPVVPPYAHRDADRRRSPPSYPPTVSNKTLDRLAASIKGFVCHLNDARAPTFRGVSSSKDESVNVGDFTLVPARDEHGEGTWMLEVLVHLKGVYSLVRPEVELSSSEVVYPFDPQRAFAFCLPGGALDPGELHVVRCEKVGSRRVQAARTFSSWEPDHWTFVSRSGRDASDLRRSRAPFTECHRVVATNWLLRSGRKPAGDDSHDLVPPVHVTFALDEPFEVRSRHHAEGTAAEVFSPGHVGSTAARRREEGHEREGRAFE
ncbi:hypothetical protein JCM8208_001478 [Rhodotorula glutinis]